MAAENAIAIAHESFICQVRQTCIDCGELFIHTSVPFVELLTHAIDY